MLQTQTVSPELLELLIWLMNEKTFADFSLAGGTSLALQIGHRNSVDIDLFGKSEIQHDLFFDVLGEYGNVEVSRNTKNIFISEVNGIKVDFVNYKYPVLDKFMVVNGVRMFSKKDIAAMKIGAITGRGSKKDFIDLYFLLEDFSLREILDFYNQKYYDGSEFMALKSLTYFDDADSQPQPKMFKEFNWEKCKNFILEETRKL
ncbi:MAG: nucleotidyl transferase AbiEii/AbiGii toxin family protein [Flavobacteriaceae bacterium]